MRSERLQEGANFRFDAFSCLRSDYANNDCSLCIELCPEEAMVFDRKKLTLDANRCTGCAACVGLCPTESLHSELFDPNRFSLEFSLSSERRLSCKENIPCLAALSVEHLVSIALRKEGETICDLAHCAECSVNRDGTVFATIEAMVEEADRFLAYCGVPKRLERAYELPETVPESGRRGFVKRMAHLAREVGEESSMSELAQAEGMKQPVKRVLLKNALKRYADSFSASGELAEPFSFVRNKRIDAHLCTNCQECAMFCPTEALTLLQDNTGIVFQMGRCIACGICNDVCRPEALRDAEAFDLVEFAFDRMQLLVKHRLEICEECKVAFPYRGGEMVCDRCRDFKENFSDLFTMAKDL
ncbi:4Fe-4S binding protein [Hydrogenimonas sp.]